MATIPSGYTPAKGTYFYAQDGTGPYTVDVKGNPILVTDPTDFLIQVGFGLVAGVVRVAALGSNPDVDVATVPEDIWPGGGPYPWMTGATALQARSTSVEDSATGTGISQITTTFLDTAYAELAPVVTNLNGTTPVPIVAPTAFRINASRPTAKGSGAAAFGVSNVGDIIIEDVAGPNTVRAIMTAQTGNLRQSVYTVPAGKTLQVLEQAWGFAAVSGGNRFAKFSIYIQGSNGIFVAPLSVAVGDEPPYTQHGLPGIRLNEKTDFCYRCDAVSNESTSLFASWLGVQRTN